MANTSLFSFSAFQMSENPPGMMARWLVLRTDLILCELGSSMYILQTLLSARRHRSWISDSGERLSIALN